MKTEKEVYIKLDQVSSRILATIDSSIMPLLDENDKFIEIRKVLYGCI